MLTARQVLPYFDLPGTKQFLHENPHLRGEVEREFKKLKAAYQRAHQQAVAAEEPNRLKDDDYAYLHPDNVLVYHEKALRPKDSRVRSRVRLVLVDLTDPVRKRFKNQMRET